MKERLPQEHHIFAAALPDLRAHFEEAAQKTPSYAFVFHSIAYDLRRAEQSVAESGVAASKTPIETARGTLIAIAHEPDFGALGGDMEAALEIALTHQKKMHNPGL